MKSDVSVSLCPFSKVKELDKIFHDNGAFDQH